MAPLHLMRKMTMHFMFNLPRTLRILSSYKYHKEYFFKTKYVHIVQPIGIFQLATFRHLLEEFSKRSLCQGHKKSVRSLSMTSEINCLADDIVKADSGTDLTKKEEMIKTLKFFIKHGCSANEIRENYLSYFKGAQCSYVKAMTLAEIDSNLLMLIPLMSLSLTSLRHVAQRAREDKYLIKDFINRIDYLSHHFELPVVDLLKLLSKHSSLLTMKFNRLDNKISILKNAEISAEYIVKDLWIFNYNEELLAGRINAAKSAGVTLKPWLLRCREGCFDSMLSKWEETQRILGGADIADYLAKKLECSQEYVQHMMIRNKLLKTINIPKLEQMIEFLYEKGYTPEELRVFPRIFSSSINTLNERFQVFYRVKRVRPAISQLCVSSKRFESMLQKRSKYSEMKA